VRRWIAIVAVALGVIGVCTTPAHADPIHAPNVEPFPITCAGTTYEAVVAPGQGGWVPALVTSGHAVLVPFSLAFTITSLATGESSTFTTSKEAAVRTATMTCRFGQIFTNPQTGETHQVVGVLQVLSNPLAS
jgi:hypothetical protein